MWRGADRYLGYVYRLVRDGRPVAGFDRVSTAPATFGRRRRHVTPQAEPFPGTQSKYEPVTLGGGITRDAEFARWASTLSNFGAAPRLDVVIGIFDDRNRLRRTVRLSRVWISKIEASDLDADGNEVAIESLTLEHEGLELDMDTDEDESDDDA